MPLRLARSGPAHASTKPRSVARLVTGLLALAASGAASAQTITPDGTRVVWMEDQNADIVLELYSAPIDGSQAPTMLAEVPGALVTFGAYYLVTPDSSRVLYFSRETGGGWGERVHCVPIDGSASPFVYDFPLPGISMGDTDPWFEIGPLGDHVIYSNEGYELYAAPIDGSSGAVLLSADATHVSLWRFDATAPRIAFRSNVDAPGLELFVTDLDGSSAPVPLRGASDSGTVSFFDITPDGSRVAYTANQDAPTVAELYSVPSDASASPIKLNPPLVAGGNIEFDFRLTADGTRVVYRADQTVDNVLELHSVPIDGSASSVQLSGPMVAGGNVSQGFRISPDGAHVVYLADATTNEVFELYSRSIDGAGASVKLNGALASGGDVTTWLIAGERVVFRADKDANDVFELFSVPIEGPLGRKFTYLPAGWPLVQLNRPLVAGGDVSGFAVSPDGDWVAYRADETVDEAVGLYSVRSGGGAVRLLSDPFPPGTSFHSLAVSPTNRAVYNASGAIFSVPIDGSAAPVLLNP